VLLGRCIVKIRILKSILFLGTAIASLVFAGGALAQNACVEQGALAWDDWTLEDAGGSGMPDGETDNDYIRCKACHGWDQLGLSGGYVKRSRNAGRPNAGAGDADQTSRDISLTTRAGAMITADMIFHAGTGRSFADGSGSWVPLGGSHSAGNKAAHSNGYTLGNQHPDFSTGGANALTQEQADCLAEFLNFADAGWDAYFDSINPDVDPILYTIRSDADADRGETRYNDVCFDCHGDPSEVGTPFDIEGGGILEFLAESGHMSEFYNKARWGNPDTVMTRDALGDPTALDVADLLLYLQELGGTGFAMNAGLNGNWFGGQDRNGEGFQFEVADDGNGGLVLVVTFYTYDDMGNQVWLLAVGPVDGDTAEVDVYIYDGATWGDGFNPADVNENSWGSGTITASSCTSAHAMLVPNASAQADGFTDLEYDLVRVTTPAMSCPAVG